MKSFHVCVCVHVFVQYLCVGPTVHCKYNIPRGEVLIYRISDIKVIEYRKSNTLGEGQRSFGVKRVKLSKPFKLDTVPVSKERKLGHISHMTLGVPHLVLEAYCFL